MCEMLATNYFASNTLLVMCVLTNWRFLCILIGDASKKSATNQKSERKIVTSMNIKTIGVQIMHKEKWNLCYMVVTYA
jgi:hypothetical protein